ncbi:MAG TPA: glycerol-3-phosphate 1-O-acyltransferase PlsY [Allosphingosinicella sp.]|uniref:glycerol-3-phosphate 1-O-acyltransferase PlsY n=1 Tax=Allosphingosinicella sp. TaxID=2823234 RepID=UPI002EDA10EE
MSAEVYAEPLLSLLLGYLLGSIPFGILLTRMSGAGDLRAIGSGNIGATNVLRTGRKGLAALTLLLDMLKGTAAVLIVRAIWPGCEEIAAIGAVVGHLWPVWLRFRGGKGVATLFGVMVGLHWPSGLIYAAVWLGVLGISRYSSLAGMSAALAAPVGAAALGRFDLALLYLGFALLVFWKHRANLDRLLDGSEPRVGGAKAEQTNA